jgi:hypothetical protein
MPYIDATKAKQIVAIAKDYIGSTALSFVDKEGNGCGRTNKWSDLLCFYELYRVAGHRIDDLINTASYQGIILKLLSKVALTPNYSLATCGGNVITTNGGCGCDGAGSTTGPTSGCKDSTHSFTLAAGQTTTSNPVLIGVDILIAIREGIVMSSSPANINGYIFDDVTGAFVANTPAGPAGESFIILYRDCNVGGGIPVPPVGLRTGTITFSGNGTTTAFNIPHGGLVVTPTWYVVGVASAAAAGVYYYVANSTNIVVTFDVAPPAGTNNIVLTWAAR